MPTAQTVSVVMATYNGSAYVADQLRSILDQRCPPMEIVIGDDQSTDDTALVITEIAKSSAVPIDLVVNDTRLGHADNFLRTAVRARGELIALADQDDVWLPDKLALAVAALSDPSVALWVHDRTMVDEQLRPTRERRFHTGISKRASRANPLHPMHGSRMVFRAGALHYFPGEDRARSVFGDRPAEHDEWATFGAHVLGRVAWESRSMILFRRHQSTVSPMTAPTVRQVLGGVDSSRYEATLAAAISRAEYLERRADVPECGEIRDRILVAAAGYRRLVPKLRRRVATRVHPGRVGRAGRLASSAIRGDYMHSPRKGGLGAFALIQDASHLLSGADA